MYVLKAQEKEGTRACWLSSSLVFAHGGRNLRHLGSDGNFLQELLLITYYTNTLIHQVIIEDVQKTDHIGPFWHPKPAANQGNLRFPFPAHFVAKHEYSSPVLLLNRIILKDI